MFASSLLDSKFGEVLRPSDYSSLSQDELQAAHRFLKQSDRLRFAVTRSVLRAHLAREINVKASDLDFSRSASGRPFLNNCPGSTIDFNVSHSGDYALIAWSHQRRVGIDIEQCSEALDWENLQHLVLGDRDRATIFAMSDEQRRTRFFDVWVAKEALLKAHGTGIGAGLADFSVLQPGCGTPDVSGDGKTACDLQYFKASWIRHITGYAACVAWSAAA